MLCLKKGPWSVHVEDRDPLHPSVTKQALWTPAGGHCQGVQRARQTLGSDGGCVRWACRASCSVPVGPEMSGEVEI